MADDALYWKRAYELLVWQTGRDLNDGYGRDPRREPPAPFARGPEPRGPGDPSRGVHAPLLTGLTILVVALAAYLTGALQ